MHLRRVLVLSFVLILTLSLGVTPLMAENASQINRGLIEYGDTENGNKTTDAGDSYTFSGHAGDIVMIALVAEFDTYLELIGPGGSEVARNDDGGDGFDSLIIVELPSTGTHTIIARGFSSSSRGDYRLTLWGFDNFETLSSIDVGDTVYGEISTEGNWDFYTFHGREGDVVTISNTSSDFDSYLHLISPDLAIVENNDDGGTGLNSLISDYVLPMQGYYTIIVRDFGDNSEGDYTLRLTEGDQNASTRTPTRTSTPSGGDDEPTHHYQGSISVGQTRTGDIEENTGDLWSFSASSGDVITIELNSDDFDTYLELFNSDGDQLVRNDDGGTGLNSMILNYQIPRSGTYTILVRSYGYYGDGDYRVSLDIGRATSTPTRTPTASPTPIIQDEGEIFYGEIVEDDLPRESSRDTYTFEAREGQSITIDLSSEDFDTYLELYNQSGNQVAYNDDGGSGLNSMLQNYMIPRDGEYTILVRSFGDYGEGDYLLSLTCLNCFNQENVINAFLIPNFAFPDNISSGMDFTVDVDLLNPYENNMYCVGVRMTASGGFSVEGDSFVDFVQILGQSNGMASFDLVAPTSASGSGIINLSLDWYEDSECENEPNHLDFSSQVFVGDNSNEGYQDRRIVFFPADLLEGDVEVELYTSFGEYLGTSILTAEYPNLAVGSIRVPDLGFLVVVLRGSYEDGEFTTMRLISLSDHSQTIDIYHLP